MGISGLRRWLDLQNCNFTVTQPIPTRQQRLEQNRRERIKHQPQKNNRNKRKATDAAEAKNGKAVASSAGDEGENNEESEHNNSKNDDGDDMEPEYDWQDGVDHLCLDMNAFVHLSYNISQPFLDAVMQKLTKMIEKSIRYFRPQRTLSLCFDGPAPISKLATQRLRRQGSTDICVSMREGEKQGFSPAELCTGSVAMYRIEKAVRGYLDTDPVIKSLLPPGIDVLFSGTREAGEGEVKIVRRLIDLTTAVRNETFSSEHTGKQQQPETNETVKQAAAPGGFFQSMKNTVSRYLGSGSSGGQNDTTMSSLSSSSPASVSPFLLPATNDSVVIMGNDTDLVLNCVACLPFHNMYVCHPDSYMLTSVSDLMYNWVRPGSSKQLSLGILPSVRLDFVFIMALAGGDHYPGIDDSDAQRIWHYYHTLRSTTNRRHDSLVAMSTSLKQGGGGGGASDAREETTSNAATEASPGSKSDTLRHQRRLIINASFLRQLVSAKAHENYHEQHQRTTHRHHSNNNNHHQNKYHHKNRNNKSKGNNKKKKGGSNSQSKKSGGDDPNPGFALLAGALWSLATATTGECPNYAYLHRNVAAPTLRSLRAAADHTLIHVHHSGVYGLHRLQSHLQNHQSNNQSQQQTSGSGDRESVAQASSPASPPNSDFEFPLLSDSPLLTPLEVFSALMPKAALQPHAVQRALKQLGRQEEEERSSHNNDTSDQMSGGKKKSTATATKKNIANGPNPVEQKLLTTTSTPSVVQLIRRIYKHVDASYYTSEERELSISSSHLSNEKKQQQDQKMKNDDAGGDENSNGADGVVCSNITFEDADSVKYDERPGTYGGYVFAAKGMQISRHVKFHRPARKVTTSNEEEEEDGDEDEESSDEDE